MASNHEADEIIERDYRGPTIHETPIWVFGVLLMLFCIGSYVLKVEDAEKPIGKVIGCEANGIVCSLRDYRTLNIMNTDGQGSAEVRLIYEKPE